MARISLCVITGNEEAIIERFLASFAPAFDELSLCRAVGCSAPDKTAELAESWCRANGKEYRFSEYRNAHTGATLDHIDNFGAARNMSFDNATGDWLFWADCDDMLEHPEKLREVLANPAAEDLIRFDYDVVGTNKRPNRERAIKRSVFAAGNRWQFSVHENLLVAAGTTIGYALAPVWVHQPKIGGFENRKRNKAILSRTLAHTSANYFYVHQEWFCEGNHTNAKRFGVLALAFPDLDPSFRYETNLNLARITPDNDMALRYAQDAHAVFPWCREALSLIALLFIERNDPLRALHFAERMDRTVLPPENLRPWTHEPQWYGWAGQDLLARCQRFAGKMDEAKVTQAGLGEPVFSLIHATRGRASLAQQCRNHWLNLAANPEKVHHIMCVDADDAQTLRLASQFEHVVSEGKSCVAAWNLGAAGARGKVLIQLSDDWTPVPGWDAKILAEVEKAGKTLDDEWVLAISDGHRKDDLLCMAILSRARYLKQYDEFDNEGRLRLPPNRGTCRGREYLFSPEYESVFSDNDFSHRAFKDGVVIDARSRLTFHHAHPIFGHGKWDATYEHNNQKERYERGQEVFRGRNPDAFDGAAKP